MIRYKKCVCVRSGVTLLTRELEHCKNHLILAQLMKYIAIFATNYPTTFSGNNHNDLKTQIFYKMKHFIFILFANIFAILNAQNTSVTIYYDKNLKGVSDEAFATYKAVFAEPTDTNYQKQFVITYLPSKKTVMEGIYYSYDRYNHEKSKFKEYKTYDKEGILVSTVEGDSSNYVLTYYYPNGKKSSETQVLNGEIHGDMIIYKNEEDVTIYVHFDHGKQVSPTDYYCRGVHTQYAITAEDTSGKLIIETVSVNDRTEEKDSQGCTWMKYVKNGLVIQASCLKGNEYGNYWTLQFIFTNYGRDWRDLCADSLFVHGIKDGNQINMEKIPMSTYMKKVKKKHANRRFWDSFAESLVTADAGKYTSSSSVSVGNKHYRVESTYYDRVERNEALRESQERQNAYSKALMEEREELANNYFKSQPLNPRETVFGVQCLKLIECDEIIAELFIDGQKYVFEWAIE